MSDTENIKRKFDAMSPEDKATFLKQIAKDDKAEIYKGKLHILENEYVQLTKDIESLQNKRRKNRVAYHSTKAYMRKKGWDETQDE